MGGMGKMSGGKKRVVDGVVWETGERREPQGPWLRRRLI